MAKLGCGIVLPQQTRSDERLVQSASGGVNQFSHDHHRARGDGWAAVGGFPGVGGGNFNLVVRNLERFSGDLTKDGFGTLPEFCAGDKDTDSSIAEALKADYRRKVALAGSGKSSSMEKSGDSNSFFARGGLIFGLKVFFLRFVITQLQFSIEKLIQIDWFANHLLRGCGLTGLEKIAATDFYRRNSERSRDAVHVAFHRKQALGRAKSAKCTMRWSIGRDGAGPYADVRPMIGSAGVNRAAREDNGRERGVGAAVNYEFDLSAQNFAFSGNGSAMPRARRMALGGGNHVFHSVVHELYRLAGFHRE